MALLPAAVLPIVTEFCVLSAAKQAEAPTVCESSNFVILNWLDGSQAIVRVAWRSAAEGEIAAVPIVQVDIPGGTNLSNPPLPV